MPQLFDALVDVLRVESVVFQAACRCSRIPPHTPFSIGNFTVSTVLARMMKKDSVHSFSAGIVRFHIPSGIIGTFLLTCLLKFALERPVAMKQKRLFCQPHI